jgi:antibiotic biosynthesis monooxygenase (ABM) superfamily enzyme
MVIPLLLQPFYDVLAISFHPILRQGLTVAIVVGLVVYMIMPKLVQLTASWLFGK